MSNDERDLIGEDDHDLVECTDDEGNTLILEVMDYFFYNGEEYAVLMDSESGCDDEDCEECDAEQNMYIMKVLNTTSEQGEEMEEFLPVDEGMLDKLIDIVQSRFSDDEIVLDDEDEDDDDYDDEDDYDEEDDEDEDDEDE
ncbi:MAG: DUF1292 domain-containing protein [Oscillospiraceae bacterium]|jgi:hypothetical protein|nr:DUF1292 domain-containing protein [Oscillospiraceae bacterium]